MDNRLGEEKVHKLLWELSIPAILGMLSNAIFNVVDRIFVGRIDPLALTGVGITMPVQIFQMALVLLIGIGSSILVSIKLGENKKEEAEDILFLALKYIVIGLVLFAVLFMIFIDPLMNLLSVSDEVMPYAKQYIVIIIIGAIFGIPGYCLNNSLRAIGKAKVSMQIIIVTSIINIILDPIFIFVFGWGIAGAAAATVLSQMIFTGFVLWKFVREKDFLINLKIRKVANESALVFQIFKNGSPSFLVQILATFVNIFTNYSFTRYGSDIDIASVTIMSTIFAFYNMVISGIVQGNQPISGYNWGVKRYDRVLSSLKYSLLYAFAISLVLFTLIMTYPDILIGLFSNDTALLENTSANIKVYLSMIVFIGLQSVSARFFQSIGKTKTTSILLFLRYGVILVPSVLILAPRMGVTGIYLSNAISDFIASVIAIIFISFEIRNLKKLSINEQRAS